MLKKMGKDPKKMVRVWVEGLLFDSNIFINKV
jgi:hypothetical protein